MDGRIVGVALNTNLADPDPEESKGALDSCGSLHDILLMVSGMEEKVR